MEKRVIIFGVCGDRCLNIFEYGNSVDYDDLVKEVASEGKHTFISTGMSTYEEIDLSLIHI